MLDKATEKLVLNLCRKNTKEANDLICEVLLSYIKIHPNDMEVRLKLIRHIDSYRRVDILDIIDYINELLQYDPDNIYALLYFVYIQRFDFFQIDDQLINKLKEHKSNDNEIMAMIAIGISWYYEVIYSNAKNEEYLKEQEKWLKKSIQYSTNQVRNYWELILFYFEHGQDNLAKPLIPLALNNIQHVFNKNYMEDKYLWDSTNVEEFFNICYKQIHVSQRFIEDLISWQK